MFVSHDSAGVIEAETGVETEIETEENTDTDTEANTDTDTVMHVLAERQGAPQQILTVQQLPRIEVSRDVRDSRSVL